MPLVINEVIAEIEPTGREEQDMNPLEEMVPLAESEFELLRTLAVIEQRRTRLMVD